MKPKLVPSLITLALVWTIGIVSIGLVPGCSTPNRTAYVVEGVVINSVETATKVFLDLVVAGKVTTAQEVAYRAKYNKYLSAQKVVEDIVNSVKPGETVDRTVLQAALNAVSASSADIISFVGAFSKTK